MGYINDKEEMIRQVFSVIKGKKLRAMGPPFLADLDIEDVKALCLEQLMGMSKQRIRHVLEGKEMEDSSDTDEESEDEVANSQSRDKKEELEEGDGDERSSEEREGAEELSVVNSDPSAATSLKKSHRI